MIKKISSATFLLVFVALVGTPLAGSDTATATSGNETNLRTLTITSTAILNLSDFGPTADGIADDGPALQSALDALAEAGGGTLIVPAGQYAINTPVFKDFSGLATSVTILGVESLTPIAHPGSAGADVAKGLDLLSEIYPRTGTQNAITIIGLQNFLIKDIAFLGTQTVVTDAAVTLELSDIPNAVINHCEFYGLATFIPGGGIVKAVRSNLKIEFSKFLGSTAASGLYVPVVENVEWHGFTITDTHFVDYGLRSGFFSKTGYGAAISWINIGNAAAPTNDSPRREVNIRSVFLDEGSYFGITSLPDRYTPTSAPIDLVYITGLVMNVPNFITTGHLLSGVKGVMVEKSHYKWSHNAYSSIDLRGVGNAILDHLTRVDHTDRIRADANTKRLTIINSPQFTQFDSLATTTKVFTTQTEEEDSVQYVRMRFQETLAREPDPAAHFYWSDLLVRCDEDPLCVDEKQTLLNDYLSSMPTATFSVSGQIRDGDGLALPGATVKLSGSQAVTTTTNANGEYYFSNLPTSGVYSISASKVHYTFDPPTPIVTPSGDQIWNSVAVLNRHTIGGRILTSSGSPATGLTLNLSGTEVGEARTDLEGFYAFPNIRAGGSYTVTPSEHLFVYSPQSRDIANLSGDSAANFTLATYNISGRITGKKGTALASVVVTLSGTRSGSAVTNATGDYLFNDLPAGGSYTITPSEEEYGFNPLSRLYEKLDGNKSADFSGMLLPILMTEDNSDIAVALNALTLVAGPFNLEESSILALGGRTRVTLFVRHLDLTLAGEESEITVRAQDSWGFMYPLGIEFVAPVPGIDSVAQVVVRLSGSLPQGGDLWLSIRQGVLESRKARIRIAGL